tara:strand:+ start:24174 stop:25991 length:1818 start_codon:yes stop_codon:yes gene_type:complete
MRKITYKKLTTQNFLSIGNDKVEIDFQNGLNLITGNNIDNPERRNGTGKSAIIESYFYALYGTTIREIKKEFVINNVTKGAGNIELIFDVKTDTDTTSYKIVRQLKPSKVELWKLSSDDSNEKDLTKDSIANTNKYINELIGSNAVLSKSCDILSLSDNTPFMAKKPEEKRKFIEDIFDLAVFGKMLKELKTEIKENKANLSISSTKLAEISNSLKSLETQRDIIKKQIEERETILQKRKDELSIRIDGVKLEISELKIDDTTKLVAAMGKLNLAKDKLSLERESLSESRSRYNAQITTNKSEMHKIDTVGSAECDKCFQKIPHTHYDLLAKNRKVFEDSLSHCNEMLAENLQTSKTLNEKVLKIDETFTTLNSKVRISETNEIKRVALNRSLSEYEESLSEVDSDLESTTQSYDSFDVSISETEVRHTEEQKNYDDLKQTSEDLEVCKFILGEEGVKSFIIKRLLTMLNQSIQDYISRLGMTMRCSFDEYFDEQITNDKGKSISYWNFSGGERRTVDLATAWAFKDIKRKISGISSNVEFSDEIFDSAFDERGLDLLIEVLKDRIDKNNLSVYAISHRKETLKHVDGEIVNLEKENGVTKRIID